MRSWRPVGASSSSGAGQPVDLGGEDEVTLGEAVDLVRPQGHADLAPSEEDVRVMGRAAAGVRGIKLGKEDHVIALAITGEDATLLVAGENGIGKRTNFGEYRVQSRGGKGIITMKTNKKTGKVVGALTVKDDNEIMIITVGGQMVRTGVKGIRETGRNTQGVRLVKLDSGDRLQDIAPVITAQKEEAAGEEEEARE